MAQWTPFPKSEATVRPDVLVCGCDGWDSASMWLHRTPTGFQCRGSRGSTSIRSTGAGEQSLSVRGRKEEWEISRSLSTLYFTAKLLEQVEKGTEREGAAGVIGRGGRIYLGVRSTEYSVWWGHLVERCD